jgi:uncharacterized lipoprotein YddW (UPF0748 family)
MSKLLLLLLCLHVMFFASSQSSPPKRELRGAWIATFANIDWPNRSQTPQQQRDAFVTIMNHHAQTGINAVYVQMRSQCDALYPSAIEPWSADLTGTQGRAPSPLWDPMQFAIEECRKRGIEFHAWLNPYRAVSLSTNLPGFSPNHIAKLHPEWTLTVGTAIILNPGLPEVRDYITSVVVDILQRYDVDGIHFDDYFYPAGTINDDASFNADPRGFTSKADWRRDNVNLLIKRVYDTVKSIKPWVKFGVSPTGIYRNSTNPDIGTNTSGLEHYTVLFADSKKWLQQGWVDYIAPQVYWYIGQPGANYGVIVPWWNNNANGRHIYVGMAGYKVNDPAQGANWANPSQIPNEVRMNRSYPNVYGQIIYNTSSLRSTTKLGFRDSLRLFFYQKPALLPTMPWRDNVAPLPPTAVHAVRYADDSVVINWTRPPAASNELDKAKRFVVYRSTDPAVNIEDANNILTITVNDTTAFNDQSVAPNTTYYYKVTAIDRFHNESIVSNVVSNVPPTINCPGTQTLTLSANCSSVLPDYRSLASTTNASSVLQSPAAGTTISGTGTMMITLTAVSVAGETTSCSFMLNKEDKTSPVITTTGSGLPGQGSTAEVTAAAGQCTFTSGTQFDLSATDLCSPPLQYSYILTRNGIASAPVIAGSLSGVVFQKGTTQVAWTIADAAGNKTSYSFFVHVSDNEAPVISQVSADPAMLLVPNHKMRNVTIGYVAMDNCGPVSTSLSVSCNESQPGSGDWEIIDNHHLKLRAERNGTGMGRIYTITITATDAEGNVHTQNLTVMVPHDHSNITWAKPVTDRLEEAVILSINATPNPSREKFVLHLQSSSAQTVSLRIVDNAGRVIETRMGIPANSEIELGGKYRPGLYFVEVSQGQTRQTLKLLKR